MDRPAAAPRGQPGSNNDHLQVLTIGRVDEFASRLVARPFFLNRTRGNLGFQDFRLTHLTIPLKQLANE